MFPVVHINSSLYGFSIDARCPNSWHSVLIIILTIQDVGGLAELFRIGAPVRCRVMDTGGVGSMKRRLKLSVNPRDVNQNMSKSSLMSGMVSVRCFPLILLKLTTFCRAGQIRSVEVWS